MPQRLSALFLLWIETIQYKRKLRERKPDTACAVPFLSINRRTPFPALKSKHLSRTSHQQANYTLCNTLQFLFPLFWCVYRSGRYLSVLSDRWAFAFVTNFQFSSGHTWVTDVLNCAVLNGSCTTKEFHPVLGQGITQSPSRSTGTCSLNLPGFASGVLLPGLLWWIFILPAWISQCNCFLSLAEDEVKNKKTKKQHLRETGRASGLQSKKQDKDKEEKEDKEDESKEEDNGSQQNRASRRKNYQRKNRDGKKAREEGSQNKDRGKTAPTKDQKESENKEMKTTKRGKEGDNKKKKGRKNR